MGTYSILFVFFFFLFSVFWTPYKMSACINEMYLDEKIGIGSRILCFIPVFNICRAEKQFLTRFGFATGATVFMFIAAIWRFVSGHFLAGVNQVLAVSGVYILLISLLAYWICNSVFVYQVISTTHAMGGFKLFLFTLIYPLGQLFIGDFLKNVIKNRLEYQAKMESKYADYDDDEEYDEDYYEE